MAMAGMETGISIIYNSIHHLKKMIFPKQTVKLPRGETTNPSPSLSLTVGHMNHTQNLCVISPKVELPE